MADISMPKEPSVTDEVFRTHITLTEALDVVKGLHAKLLGVQPEARDGKEGVQLGSLSEGVTHVSQLAVELFGRLMALSARF